MFLYVCLFHESLYSHPVQTMLNMDSGNDPGGTRAQSYGAILFRARVRNGGELHAGRVYSPPVHELT
jgi:hypothetical protein